MPLFKVILFWVFFNLTFHGLIPMLALNFPAGWIGYVLAGITGTLFALGLTLVFLKLEKKTLADIGLVFGFRSIWRFVAGFAGGIIICLVMVLGVIVLSPFDLRVRAGADFFDSLAISFIIMFWLGLMEEISHRSFPLLKLKSEYGLRTAIYISSIAFALYHGLALGNLLGPGVWGLFFGLMAVWSKGIALPFGFHVGLNQVLAVVGEKPKYVEGAWAFVDGGGSGLLTPDQVGFGMQVILLLAGVALIEWYVRRVKCETST